MEPSLVTRDKWEDFSTPATWGDTVAADWGGLLEIQACYTAKNTSPSCPDSIDLDGGKEYP